MNKSLTLAFAFALGLALLVYGPIVSADGQSPDREAQKQEVAQAKEIIRRLRAGELLSREELEVLESLVTAVEKAVSSEEAAQKTTKSTPTPATTDPRGSKPTASLALGLSRHPTKDGLVYAYAVDLGTTALRSFWLDRANRPYTSIARLEGEQYRAGYSLQFAINGGIFDQRRRPQGLYIEQGKVLAELDTTKPGTDAGNFYLEPNGVFLVDSQNNARILTTQRFTEHFPSSKARASIRLAVQSGPALLVDGRINSVFAEQSMNKKRRTGVGVIDARRVVFGMSAEDISFYDFAAVFARLGM